MLRKLPRRKRRSKPQRTPRTTLANLVRKESIAFLREGGEVGPSPIAPRGTRLCKTIWLRLCRDRPGGAATPGGAETNFPMGLGDNELGKNNSFPCIRQGENEMRAGNANG